MPQLWDLLLKNALALALNASAAWQVPWFNAFFAVMHRSWNGISRQVTWHGGAHPLRASTMASGGLPLHSVKIRT